MHPNDAPKPCVALLLGMNGKRSGEQCGAAAEFTSRDKPCCWVHYQADTSGPRAGKVKFAGERR